MIRDVTEATFQQDVIDRSHEVPVVVDDADGTDVDRHAAVVGADEDERGLLFSRRVGDELIPAIASHRPARLVDQDREMLAEDVL